MVVYAKVGRLSFRAALINRDLRSPLCGIFVKVGRGTRIDSLLNVITILIG